LIIELAAMTAETQTENACTEKRPYISCKAIFSAKQTVRFATAFRLKIVFIDVFDFCPVINRNSKIKILQTTLYILIANPNLFHDCLEGLQSGIFRFALIIL